MTDDHTFIDTAGHAICGKSQCLAAWRGFFASFPAEWRVYEDTPTNRHTLGLPAR